MPDAQCSTSKAAGSLEQSKGDIFWGTKLFKFQAYNTLQEAELLSSEYYRLNQQDLRHFGDFLSVLVDMRAHGHLFCSEIRCKI